MNATTTGIRPRLHFTPRSGWMNDPHGLTFHEGRYHLFFQHVPDSLGWRKDCHWGHATSTDLLHWEEQPIALHPGDGDVGIWSGCLVVDDGAPRIYYTSVHEPDLGLGEVRVARPVDDAWQVWTKGETVVTSPRPGTSVFRDPVVFRDRDRWRMVVGFGASDGTAGAETFVSDDLESWEATGLLGARGSDRTDPWTGTAWECPQLVLSVGGIDVLVVSVWEEGVTHDVVGAVGRHIGGRFTAEAWQPLTVGKGHYAASAFTDAEGRACLVFWIRGIGEPGAWTGAISVPYLVGTDRDRIRLTPHPAVADARTAPGGDLPAATLDVEWRPGPTGRLRLVGADGQDRAALEMADGRLVVSAGDGEPVVVAHDSAELRVLVDGQVLEVVADGGLVGLPLAAGDGGVLPVADDPAGLAWWHLA